MTLRSSGSFIFSQPLNRKEWSTLDLSRTKYPAQVATIIELEAPDCETLSQTSVPSQEDLDFHQALQAARSTDQVTEWSSETHRQPVVALLRRCFANAGASVDEAARWTVIVEASAWGAVERCAIQDGPDGDGVAVPAALRLYRSEARRISSALKDNSVASGLLARLRSGTLSPEDVLSLSPDEFLPAAKRARLEQIRKSPLEESGHQKLQYPFHDEQMACPECDKAGSVRYRRMVSVREGYCKAETWGSKDNDDRGERCQGYCPECFSEWLFEM